MHMNMMHTEDLHGNMTMMFQGHMSTDTPQRETLRQSTHM